MTIINYLTSDDIKKNITNALIVLQEAGFKNHIFSEGSLTDSKYLAKMLELIQGEEWELENVSSALDQLRGALFLQGFKNKLPHASCCSNETNWSKLAKEIVAFLEVPSNGSK